MSRFWLPIFTLWQRDLIRFWREKGRVFGYVGSPLLFWLLIGSGFGDLAFYFPGTLVLTVMFSAVFSSMSVIEDRREGFLLSMLVSPAPRTSMVLGKVLGSATLAWIQGLLFLCFAPMAGFTPGLSGIVEACMAILLVAFAFTVLGFYIAWNMESTQGFHAIMNLILFPLWLISGAVFPMAKAHGWVQWLMRFNPLTYSVEAVRVPLAHPSPVAGPAFPTSMLITTCFAAVFFFAATAVANRKRSRTFA